jgi:hypothetical protein
METRSRARSSHASDPNPPLRDQGGSAGVLGGDRFTPFGPPLPARVRNLAGSRAYSLDRASAAGRQQPSDQSPAASDSLVWDGLGLSSANLHQDGAHSDHVAATNDRSDRGSEPVGSEHGGSQPASVDSYDYGFRYVTPQILADELRRVSSAFESSVLRAQQSISQSIPHYIDAAESRVTEAVLTKVASEYNRIGISCI